MTLFLAKYWRHILMAAIAAGFLFVAVKSCQHQTDVLVGTATEKGAVTERAANNNEVLKNAETIAKVDAINRNADPVERMRGDKNCRDCTDSE